MTTKKINIQNREKQFLKITAKYANNPLLEDIKFLYMNNEIKTIRSVESNLNKPIKLKKDGTPYAASVKRLDNIKKQVQKLKAPKKIDSETKNFNRQNLSAYNYADHIKTLYNKLPPNPSSINPENHFYLPDLPSWVTFNDAGEYEDGGLQNISVKIRSKKEADNWAKDKKTLSRELKLSPRDEKTYEF